MVANGRKIPSRLSDASDPGGQGSRVYSNGFVEIVPGSRTRDSVSAGPGGVHPLDSIGGATTFSSVPSMTRSRVEAVVGAVSALPASQRTGHAGAVLCATLDKTRGLLVTGGRDCRVKCFSIEVGLQPKSSGV